MKIPTKQLKVFVEIYQRKYGVVISDTEAYEVAFYMMNLLQTIYDKTKED